MRRRLAGAILGFGNVAERGHLAAWRAREDVELVAIAEPDAGRRARAAALFPHVACYDDAATLLRRESVDFVDIAAPPALHAPLIVAAAGAGVHVLCEKPLVVSLAEFHRVRDAIARAGVTLFTVHNWIYSEPYRRVRELVDAGTVGKLTSITIEVTRDGCAAAADNGWRTRGALAGGGILVDHGWHAFYVVLALVGQRAVSVRAQLDRRRYLTADVEDTAHCTIEFPTAAARVELTWAGDRRHTSWQIGGDAGEIRVADDHIEARSGGRTESIVCAESLSDGSHHPAWFGAVIEAFRREIDEPGARGANFAEAEQCLRLLAGAYASGADGGRPQVLRGA
ncbi:MAG TPA: Gfo/Idh/MocA family oxidoreductase [Candidatus Binatia bacterium]|nr:Gfo/Idh/MocA family oxidoreductase [Candidatus Binatia bacterium]